MEEKNILLLEKEADVKTEPIKAAVFSSATFPKEEVTEEYVEPKIETKKEQVSSVIEKPNYDFIEELTPEEEQKVYKIEKEKVQEKPKMFGKRLRLALFSLVFAVCSIWGITNIISISNLQSEISAVNEVYQLNLANYLSKLGTLDTASNYNELFPTYPEAQNPPASVEKTSNWFDRICDFIAGIFGG